MARRILVRNSSDRLSKNAALCLIRRLLAVPEYDMAGRLIAVTRVAETQTTSVDVRQVRERVSHTYIPEKMPPAEIRNGPDTGGWCKFVPPHPAEWRILTVTV